MNKISFYPFSDKTSQFAPKPIPATKSVPEWYKKQPGTIDESNFIKQGMTSSTIKRCMPIFDYMTAGYIISVPCDIYIDATNPEKIEWSVPQSMKPFGSDMFASHAREQYDHYPVDKDLYHRDLFRIMPFWSVKTPPGYSAIFTHPIHKDPVPFLAIGGLVDTDDFITDGHLSFLIQKDFVGVIKQGTPLVQVIPFLREDWEMETVEPQQASKEVQTQRLNLRSTFVNGYRNKMRKIKEWR
jgi:hypothetical protein